MKTWPPEDGKLFFVKSREGLYQPIDLGKCGIVRFSNLSPKSQSPISFGGCLELLGVMDPVFYAIKLCLQSNPDLQLLLEVLFLKF